MEDEKKIGKETAHLQIHTLTQLILKIEKRETEEISALSTSLFAECVWLG